MGGFRIGGNEWEAMNGRLSDGRQSMGGFRMGGNQMGTFKWEVIKWGLSNGRLRSCWIVKQRVAFEWKDSNWGLLDGRQSNGRISNGRLRSCWIGGNEIGGLKWEGINGRLSNGRLRSCRIGGNYWKFNCGCGKKWHYFNFDLVSGGNRIFEIVVVAVTFSNLKDENFLELFKKLFRRAVKSNIRDMYIFQEV